MPRKLLHSCRHALHGLKTVAREERNFRIQLLTTILVTASMVLLDFDKLEFSIVVLTMAFVLTLEILNTLIEDMLNHIEPKPHPMIGKLKDMMAGAVLIGSIGAILIGIAIVGSHFLVPR